MIAYFLVYVNDLLLIGSDTRFMVAFKASLSPHFSLKNMGTPHYFLGVELVPVTFGIQLSQHKFIRDILERFGMTESKPSPTPLSITATLKLHDGTPTIGATQYCQIIRALQYLNLTQPDLSFAINKLA